MGNSGGFNDNVQRCIGEELPPDWNTGIVFNIRYMHNNDLLQLYGVRKGNSFVVNLAHVDRDQIMGMVFNLDRVHTIHGSLEQMIPDIENMIRSIEETLINPIVPLLSRNTGTQTVEVARALPNAQTSPDDFQPDNDLREGRRNHPIFRNVGYNDLYPFAHGPGMLYPTPGYPRPMMPDPNMPFGTPPGARYDPILPRGGRPVRPRVPRGYPDPDHLPPPGFDNWFM
ncbi:hypothetical protein CBL_13238 [Carabus blaptoides fortunei]